MPITSTPQQPAGLNRGLVRLFLPILLLGGLVLSSSCRGDGGCQRGQLCECSGGTDCYLGCDGDGCDQTCFSANHCGAVCGNDCSHTWHDGNDCTSDCGDDCNVSCHTSMSCGAFCGARCVYECSNVTTCGVRVGPASVVTCSQVNSCTVECTGSCQVQ